MVKRVCRIFRGAEVAITRNAVDQRRTSNALAPTSCSPGVFVPARLSAGLRSNSRSSAPGAVDERGALQRNAADAAAGKAAVSKRQPGEVALRQREFSNRTNSTSVSSSAACENSAARSAQGYCSCGVLCFISTRSIAHTATRTTNKKTAPEECMLKNPTQVNHCVHLSDSML